MGLLYGFLRWLVRSALAFYFTEIEVRGKPNVPVDGPLLMMANHHNGMIDPLLLVAGCDRPVRFIAKAPLFKIPILGFLMRCMGAIPAYRQQDQGYAKDKNDQLFQAAGEALAAGGAIGIFPEGRSHTDPTLGEFKHGAARLALDAEARAEWRLGLRVQLVGIHFERTRIFRGKVLITFAPAASIDGLKDLFASDPRAAVESLTATLRERMEGMVLTAENEDLIRMAEIVENFGILHEKETGIRGKFGRKKFLLDQYQRLKETRPAEIEEIVHLLRHYRQLLDILGVRDTQVGEDYRWTRAFTFAFWNTLALGLTLPFAAAGAILNGLPYAFIRVAVRLGSRSLDVRASIGLLLGIVLFPIWYAGLSYWGWRTLDPRIWIPAVSAAPFFGAATFAWLDRLRRVGRATWGLWTTIRLPSVHRRLRGMRAEILARIERLA